MDWNLNEAIAYYKKQGAPGDQTALVSLLREVQKETGGKLVHGDLGQVADGLGVRKTFLEALIRRIPSLYLEDRHCLEICAGPNCGKCTALASAAEMICSDKVTVRFVPCMRMCGKGPNIRWDGKVHHQADTQLLRSILKGVL